MSKEVLSIEAMAEAATGCLGAGDAPAEAKKLGFPIITILDTSSSAGDWDFLVSRDNESWQIFSQRNNYPNPGVSYTLGEEIYRGSLSEVYEILQI
jgi:hypothetical protein